MKIKLTLRPGDQGTRKLQLKYGGRLVAVRYRYDPERSLRYKTVELIEEQLPWIPAIPSGQDSDAPVLVRIAFDEAELRQAAKSSGARWDSDRKLWRMTYGLAHALGLGPRIVS